METENISINISPKTEGRSFKSIKSLSWSNVPNFSIITGPNGSGKTHLLELLAYYFTGATPQKSGSTGDFPVEVTIDGGQYQSNDVAYVPSGGRFSGGSPVSLRNFQDIHRQHLQSLSVGIRGDQDIFDIIRNRRLMHRLRGKNHYQLDEKEIIELFSSNNIIGDDIDITANLSQVFVIYRLKMAEALESQLRGDNRKVELLGPSPWDVLDDALRVAEFPYTIVPPTDQSFLESYTLKVRDRTSGLEIGVTDLSSGEKVLFQIILWLFGANQDTHFPKLLLLDEPDAHLHPSMTRHFLTVISEILVDKYNIRVIMTTHSPSTVALAPEGSIFQLHRNAEAVEKVTNKQNAISVLTAGLVTVSPSTIFCFVEDNDDVQFYTTVSDILMDKGPSRDPMGLMKVPSIVFIAASLGSGKEKTSGGATIVKKWVDKLDADPLISSFRGIIDKDSGNKPSNRVQVLNRYSFENYLLDPINIFCLLLDLGNDHVKAQKDLRPGDEHLLRSLPEEKLQPKVDLIVSRIQNEKPELKTDDVDRVEYSTGQSVIVPSWVYKCRGHDLLPIVQSSFGDTRGINTRSLLKALRRGRMIPIDLANIIRNLQN